MRSYPFKPNSQALVYVVPREGIEPPTLSFEASRSKSGELTGQTLLGCSFRRGQERALFTHLWAALSPFSEVLEDRADAACGSPQTTPVLLVHMVHELGTPGTTRTCDLLVRSQTL